MKFSLGDTGADHINSGIGNIFKALAMAPMVQQQAAQQTALRDAQTYHANMGGNKAGAEAESERYTLGRRQAVPDLIAADPNMPAYMQAAYKLFDLTGDTNADRVAKAGTEMQTQGIRQKAVENVGDVDVMNRYNTLAKPGDTYMPFDDIASTGYALNKATGKGGVADATLAKLFGDKNASEIGQHNAQAANAYASAGQHKASTENINVKTDRLKAGGTGKPLTAAQLRENTAIQTAREALQGMTEPDVTALLAKDSFSLTPGDKQKIALINQARKPMYGEDEVPSVSPQPAPAPAPKERGTFGKIIDSVFGGAAPAKSAAVAPAAPTMAASGDKSAQAIKAAYQAGKITREEAKKQLQAIGFN